MLCPKEIINAMKNWKTLFNTNSVMNRVIAVKLILPVFRLTAVYVRKLLGGDAVSGFVYCINSCIIFSPRLKDNIISLGNFCYILQ